MQLPASYNELIEASNSMGLYKALIHQLNKDFLYANITTDFDSDVTPKELKLQLHEIVYTLIQERFSDYLNLLYIIDVPETKVKKLDGNDTLKLSEEVSFLILLREWQKVWYKHTYS